MSFKLASYESVPPGGFYYVQTDGIQRTFPSVPIIEDLARAVSRFRAGNILPRASLAEALDDIESFTCYRLGNNPRFCVNHDADPSLSASVFSNAIAPNSGGGCKGCGASPS